MAVTVILFFPGHGQPTGKTELRRFRENTLAWVARVKTLSDEGKTVAEIKNDAQNNNILNKFNLEN